MKNYKMILQYDGTRYDGWQKQGNTANTIQGKLEQVLERMCGEQVEVHGAGRTDAGVHAKGQTANFKLSGEWEAEQVRRYLNRYLPEDIEAISLEQAPERFHSRLSAEGKIYVYRMALGGAKHVFQRQQLWPVEGELDVEAMRRAASLLEGEHDFKSFCANRRMKKSTVRRIRRITLEELPGELRVTCEGNGFLYRMVRILIGTLLEVGRGLRRPEEMKVILEGRSRELAGPCAPARGLCLEKVIY